MRLRSGGRAPIDRRGGGREGERGKREGREKRKGRPILIVRGLFRGSLNQVKHSILQNICTVYLTVISITIATDTLTVTNHY